MDDLQQYLAILQPGEVSETRVLEGLLALSWNEFDGDDEGMAGHKLRGRMEKVEWHPPFLSFVIERHGRRCCGSTRADLQRWTLNMDTRTARVQAAGHRQLLPMTPRVSIKGLAQELAQRIAKGDEDERMLYRDDWTVAVLVGKIYPAGSGYKQTVESRRRRLHEALVEALAGSGWEPRCRHVFERRVNNVKRHNLTRNHNDERE